MFDFTIIRKTQRDVVARLKEIEASAEGLQARRREILNAPTTKADVLAVVPGWVQRKAQSFKGDCLAVFRDLSDPSSLNTSGRADGLLTRLFIDKSGARADGTAVTLAALCAVFGDQMQLALSAAVSGMDWPSNALPVAGRAEELSRVDYLLGELDAEYKKLTAEAEKAGLAV